MYVVVFTWTAKCARNMCVPAVAPPPARFRRVIHTGSPKSGVYSLPAALYYESRRHPPRPPESATPASLSPTRLFVSTSSKGMSSEKLLPGQEKETPVLGQKETPLPGQDEKETLEPARKRNRCDEDAKEDDDDPAIFILFSSWDIILLNPVPTPYTGVPAAGTGVNAVATSFTWFADFLDRLAIQVGMTQDNFVRDADRKREPGVFHGVRHHTAALLETDLGRCLLLGSQGPICREVLPGSPYQPGFSYCGAEEMWTVPIVSKTENTIRNCHTSSLTYCLLCCLALE